MREDERSVVLRRPAGVPEVVDRRHPCDASNPRWKRQLVGRLFAGFGLAALVGLGGLLLEGWSIGRSAEDARAQVEEDVRRHLTELTTSLRTAALAVATQTDLVERTVTGADGAPELFARLRAIEDSLDAPDLALTVYSTFTAPLAWSGRPSELPADRLAGPATLFVAPSPLGLRLVWIEPVVQPDQIGAPRIATVAAERVLSPSSGVGRPADDHYMLHTSLVPVRLRARYEGAGEVSHPDTFIVNAPAGDPLLEVQVEAEDLLALRRARRAAVAGLAFVVLALTMLTAAVPVAAWRERTRRTAAYLGATSALLASVGLAWLFLSIALRIRSTPASWLSPEAFASRSLSRLAQSPADFALLMLAALAVVGMATDAVDRLRWAVRRRAPGGRLTRFIAAQIGGGLVVAAALAVHHHLVSDAVDGSTTSLVHYSVHPWDPARLAVSVGLIALDAVAIWSAVLALLVAGARWRVVRRDHAVRAVAVGLWVAPSVAIALAGPPGRFLPGALPLTVALAVVCGFALVWVRGRRLHRKASQAVRLLAMLLLLVIPALAMYPAVFEEADAAKRRLIEARYAAQAANHPHELLARLQQSLRQFDGISSLSMLFGELNALPVGPPQTDTAFFVWRQTDLAEYRLTSAIELYRSDGRLASRFALNFPEYKQAALPWQGGTGCTWDVFGEASPFGSQERRMLHAERSICDASGRRQGAVVLHVLLDYSTLPFISSQNPYFEIFRTSARPREGTPGGDVELVIYGWGRLPTYSSRPDTWPLDEQLFARIYASRQPFWTTISTSQRQSHVYVTNDRAGIYAVGYPVPSLFDHLVNLAELASLAGLTYLALVVGAIVIGYLGGRQPQTGRVLLREIRGSFYRKLFLAFVAASVIPVLTLAIVIRSYFAALLRDNVEAEAARTAAVAQRVIEESEALQRRGPEALGTVDDDVMVWISQIIDQDVNIFSGPRLVATSERDLFQSGLLPTRTPDDVYRAIALERRAGFVGDDAIGTHSYILAASPVRLGNREVILTVPLGLRQQEIEGEIDDLDRGVYLAAVVFVLLAAGAGLYMAERIADPVNRLTRATRRIAHGDLDARVAVRSADELQRLVEAFNSMAEELKTQRGQLERTHRLEAWAEMARQVAHEIKNPLTPIQLSAEHLRRVHADGGRPLGQVLEGCVDTILTQVRLLRQISAEFSSFGSSPTARPAATPVRELIEEVVGPYRSALAETLAIAVHVPDALPAVWVDRVLVARALTNIIENAVHAMPGGGTVTIQAAEQGGRLRIDISDTGIGMDDEGIARIFEPYFSTKAVGTGLGLTIARRNIELNQGTIEVDSAKGRGTTVTVTLPVVADPRGGVPSSVT